MNEFEVIREFFARQPVVRSDVVLGIGDDAALLNVPAGQELVVSTDLLVGDVHFSEDTDADAVGHKALAVNLSDLAAMGATPAWFTLNLSMPSVEVKWMEGFCRGLYALADRYQVALVGGDTTRGPLTLGIQIMGFAPAGTALRRSTARVGDRIYVTGQIGDAALGLRLLQGGLQIPEAFRASMLARLHRPEPRIDAGLKLRGLATSCIDLSDGLAADLGHILEASGIGARLDLERLPRSPAYASVFDVVGWEPALAGGDDYELCFTAPAAREPELQKMFASLGLACSAVGEIEAQPGLRIFDQAGKRYTPAKAGYDHFRRV